MDRGRTSIFFLWALYMSCRCPTSTLLLLCKSLLGEENFVLFFICASALQKLAWRRELCSFVHLRFCFTEARFVLNRVKHILPCYFFFPLFGLCASPGEAHFALFSVICLIVSLDIIFRFAILTTVISPWIYFGVFYIQLFL